jgi:hypothetical protein
MAETAASAPETVVKKLEGKDYATYFRALFGPSISSKMRGC